MSTDLADPVDPVPDTDTAEMAVDAAVLAAEQLLTARLGAQVKLADPEDLGGSGRAVVLRVRVARTPFTLPRTLVIKHSPGPPPERGPDLFAQEAASCQLFTALRREDRPGPELIACDPAHRLLVLEDLGRSGTVANLLQSGDASRAEQALLDWAHALGKLHATTRDREPDFAALLRRLGAPLVSDPIAEHGRAAVAGLPTLLRDELDVSVPPDALTAVHRAAELLDGRPYRAFSPADLGPENAVVTGRTVRFTDFEGGGFRTALLDAAQLQAPLPSSLVALAFPPGMPEAMVSAWHAEVLGAWPDLGDRQVLAGRLLAAHLVWIWLCTWWLLPVPRPRTPVPPDPTGSGATGTVPDRGGLLVHRWERLAAEAELAGNDVVADHAAQVAGGLRGRFRIGGDPLPHYPVFREAR